MRYCLPHKILFPPPYFSRRHLTSAVETMSLLRTALYCTSSSIYCKSLYVQCKKEKKRKQVRNLAALLSRYTCCAKFRPRCKVSIGTFWYMPPRRLRIILTDYMTQTPSFIHCASKKKKTAFSVLTHTESDDSEQGRARSRWERDGTLLLKHFTDTYSARKNRLVSSLPFLSSFCFFFRKKFSRTPSVSSESQKWITENEKKKKKRTSRRRRQWARTEYERTYYLISRCIITTGRLRISRDTITAAARAIK